MTAPLPSAGLFCLTLLAQGLWGSNLPAQASSEPGSPKGDGLAPYRSMLEDLDRDEARELAMRCLVTRPESPAAALQAWAAGKPWWRRLALVRVLGERGELSSAELERALADKRWPVRLMALRVAGLPPGKLSTAARIAELLDDEYARVRRECLHSLARRRELSDEIFLRLLARPGFASDLIAIYLARPADHGPSVLKRLLSRKKWAARVLEGLPGRRLGPSAAVLLRYVRSKAPAGLRCLALTALPRRLWPKPVLPLVQKALRETPLRREALMALSVQLEQTEKATLMKGVASDESEDRFLLRLRMSKGLEIRGPLLDQVLAELDVCSADRLEALSSWFETCGNKNAAGAWKARLVLRLEKTLLEEAPREAGASPRDDAQKYKAAGLARALMAVLSPYANPKHPAIAKSFLARLAQKGPLSEIAFRSLQDVSYVPARVAYVRRAKARLAQHARSLLLHSNDVEARFWLDLLRSDKNRLRWIATQGLKGRSHLRKIRKPLDAAFASEQDEGVLSGLLQSLLYGADEDAALALCRSVLSRKIASLDETWITLMETIRRPRLDGVLDLMDAGRLARSSLLIRAFRWQVPAIREVLAQPERYSEKELRKLRKRLARVLGKADLPLLARFLLGEGGKRALPFVRSEVVEWLRIRRDLQVDELIERAYEAEPRMEIKEGLCAALVERGRLDLLKPLIDKWMLHEDEEAFGLLFEVLGALRGEVEREQCRFLMRLFLAPMTRDPLAAIRKERNQQTLRKRLGVLFPMLQPVMERLVQAEPALIEEVLLEALRDPDLRQAFAAMSKSYLLRALYVAGGYEGGIECMRPLLALASHMVPRPHEADGAFALLLSGVSLQEGDLQAAFLAYQHGLLELALADWSPRLLEFLAGSLYREAEGFGAGLLRAKLALLEARLRLSQNMPEKAREAAERARLAIAPQGFGPEDKRFLQKLTSQADRSGR